MRLRNGKVQMDRVIPKDKPNIIYCGNKKEHVC